MERYMDEKHSEVVYEVITEVQPPAPKRKRPLWRRFVRVLLAIVLVSMLWSTFAPVIGHTFKHTCGRYRDHQTQPFQPINVDIDTTEPLKNYTFPANLANFWIKQDSFHGFTRTTVVGNVIVHSCDKASNISAHFEFNASDDGLLDRISIEPKDDGILFKLDPFSLLGQTVNATIYLVIPKKNDYKLDGLNISTIELDVWLKDTFTTPINAVSISTVSGSATTLGKGDNLLDIGNLSIATVSGDITGEFPLQHALALEAVSGAINANISSEKLPEEPALFKTNTVTGSTTAKFISSLHPRPLYSKHQSISGSVDVFYPGDWQGGLKLKTTSGEIDVEGKGTKIVKKEKNIAGKLWKVIKGDGKSKGFIGTVSGEIGVHIGTL